MTQRENMTHRENRQSLVDIINYDYFGPTPVPKTPFTVSHIAT